MKEELKNKIAYYTLIISIASLVATLFVLFFPVAVFFAALSIIGIILSAVCLSKKILKVGRVSLICSIASLLIEIIFIWMYFIAK